MTLQDRSRAQAASAPSAVIHAFPASRRAAVRHAGRRQSPQDPAFRAIERQRAAHEAFGKALDRLDRNGGKGNVSKREDDRYAAAMEHLLTTRPATRAGLLALLRYARESKDVSGYLDGGNGIMVFLESIEASCAALIPAQPAPTYLNSDAALLDLGEKLKPLFAEWMILDPDSNRKYEKTQRLVKRDVGLCLTNTPAHAKSFRKASARTGYDKAYDRCTATHKKISRLAHAMLKSPAQTSEGRTLQAIAALIFDPTFEEHICSGFECEPAQSALWAIALAAGFAVPDWFRKQANEKARSRGRSPARRRKPALRSVA
jgi:hypothetical protein